MPFKPESRLYRSFAASNFQPVERDSDEGGESYVVRGMFTTFNQFYELLPGFYERVDPHALDEADMSDTIMQYDHSGPVMARKRNGSLRIGIDPDGGWCEADLSGCQQARDLYEAIRNGLVVEMSFGFTVADDGFEWEEDDDGTVRSTITKVNRIYDISAVSIPANPNTEISARSYIDAAIEARSKKAEQESQPDEPEPVEQRSADNVLEPVMAETEAFDIDIDAIVDQVMERMSKQPAEAPEDVPEEAEEPEASPEDAEQALEDAERGTQAERRRRRRMRALRMLDI